MRQHRHAGSTAVGAVLLGMWSVGPATPAIAVPVQLPPGQRTLPYAAVDIGEFSSTTPLNDLGELVGYHQTADGAVRAVRWRPGELTELGTLGGAESYPVDLSNVGVVAGTSQTASGRYHAFHWQDGVMTDLGTLGGAESRAAAVNDRGEVVGHSQTRSGQTHAFHWHDGVMTDLGTLGGSASYAVDINNLGEVIGTSETRSGSRGGFRWQRGVMTALRPLSGGYSYVTAINDRGHVLGLGSTPTSPANWCLWLDGTVVDTGLDDDNGATVNNLDQVVGTRVSGGNWRAVVWQRGSSTDLPLPAGDRSSYGAGINDRGQVVGYSGTDLVRPRAVLWDRGRPMTLPLTAPDHWFAYSVNNRGDVAGEGRWLDGTRHSIIWLPLRPPVRHLPPGPAPRGAGPP
jgi:probable HAF family extracellular repeat protein